MKYSAKSLFDRSAVAVAGDRYPSNGTEMPKSRVTISAMAEIGALIGDQARMNMLFNLLSHDELTAGALAESAGITPQTASQHIAKLIAARLIKRRCLGKRHLHRLGSREAQHLLMAVKESALLARSHPLDASQTDPPLADLKSQ